VLSCSCRSSSSLALSYVSFFQSFSWKHEISPPIFLFCPRQQSSIPFSSAIDSSHLIALFILRILPLILPRSLVALSYLSGLRGNACSSAFSVVTVDYWLGRYQRHFRTNVFHSGCQMDSKSDMLIHLIFRWMAAQFVFWEEIVHCCIFWLRCFELLWQDVVWLRCSY